MKFSCNGRGKGKAMKLSGNRTRVWTFLVRPLVALRYCRFAQRDEKNGFLCTSALEWRKAAELAASFPLLADHCWQEWERIMRLPRCLADPIRVAPAVELTSHRDSKATGRAAIAA